MLKICNITGAEFMSMVRDVKGRYGKDIINSKYHIVCQTGERHKKSFSSTRVICLIEDNNLLGWVRYNQDLDYGYSDGIIEIYEIMRIKCHHSVLSHSDMVKILLRELIERVGGKKSEIIFECDRKKNIEDYCYVNKFFVFIKTFDYKVRMKRYKNKIMFNFVKNCE